MEFLPEAYEYFATFEIMDVPFSDLGIPEIDCRKLSGNALTTKMVYADFR